MVIPLALANEELRQAWDEAIKTCLTHGVVSASNAIRMLQIVSNFDREKAVCCRNVTFGERSFIKLAEMLQLFIKYASKTFSESSLKLVFEDLLLKDENTQQENQTDKGQTLIDERNLQLGSLGVVPLEIFQIIFSWLSVPELLLLHEVSKSFNYLSHNEYLWRNITEREFSDMNNENVINWNAQYKEHYLYHKVWGIWTLTTDHHSMHSFYIRLSNEGQVIYAPDPSCVNSWDFGGDSIRISFNNYSTYVGKLLAKKHPLIFCGHATNKGGSRWNWTATKVSKEDLIDNTQRKNLKIEKSEVSDSSD